MYCEEYKAIPQKGSQGDMRERHARKRELPFRLVFPSRIPFFLAHFYLGYVGLGFKLLN